MCVQYECAPSKAKSVSHSCFVSDIFVAFSIRPNARWMTWASKHFRAPWLTFLPFHGSLGFLTLHLTDKLRRLQLFQHISWFAQNILFFHHILEQFGTSMIGTSCASMISKSFQFHSFQSYQITAFFTMIPFSIGYFSHWYSEYSNFVFREGTNRQLNINSRIWQ